MLARFTAVGVDRETSTTPTRPTIFDRPGARRASKPVHPEPRRTGIAEQVDADKDRAHLTARAIPPTAVSSTVSNLEHSARMSAPGDYAVLSCCLHSHAHKRWLVLRGWTRF
jgi:hypothetical protein